MPREHRGQHVGPASPGTIPGSFSASMTSGLGSVMPIEVSSILVKRVSNLLPASRWLELLEPSTQKTFPLLLLLPGRDGGS